jgi:hypothetical protein
MPAPDAPFFDVVGGQRACRRFSDESVPDALSVSSKSDKLSDKTLTGGLTTGLTASEDALLPGPLRCAPPGIRTRNLRIKSPLLCR